MLNGHRRSSIGGGVAEAMEPADGELLFRVSHGDENAYRAIFRRHERACYRLALALTRSVWDAEEAVGSAFAALWHKRQRVRLVDDSVLPWLLTVVSFAAKNQLRGAARYRRLLGRVPRGEVEPDHADEVARVADAEGVVAEVREVLGTLNARDAAVVALCLVQGLSMADAAAALGVPEGTVKSRLSRVRARLRSDLAHLAPGAKEVTE